MARRLVDLSVAINNTTVADPPPLRPRITYHGHDDTFAQMGPFFPGLSKEDLPDGKAWAVEDLQISTHNGTHIDAPWHYHPTMDGLAILPYGAGLFIGPLASGPLVARLRHGCASDTLSHVPRGARGRNRRLVLGCAVRSYRAPLCPIAGPFHHLGRP